MSNSIPRQESIDVEDGESARQVRKAEARATFQAAGLTILEDEGRMLKVQHGSASPVAVYSYPVGTPYMLVFTPDGDMNRSFTNYASTADEAASVIKQGGRQESAIGRTTHAAVTNLAGSAL